jgi:hypothetical protein
MYCNIGKSSKKQIPQKVKTLWRNMLNRCYNPNKNQYQYYGGSGVTVCDSWLDEYIFYKSIQTLENYDKWINDTKNIYSLDKDALSKTELKTYSPETCKFITREEQNQLHKDVSKIIVINKITNEVKIYNSMTKVAEDLGMYRSVIGRIINNTQTNKTDYIFIKSDKWYNINNIHIPITFDLTYN